MKHMYPAKNTRELEEELRNLKSFWSRESLIATKAVLLLCRMIEGKARNRRSPSAWQKFFGQAVKDGKTAKQAASDWKGRK